jgi:enoyl-CoA hydratase/carnithine racemase
MLDLQLDGGIARLILSRPEARNAVLPGAWPIIAERAEEAVSEGARMIFLAGAGGNFCAGADLESFRSLFDDPAARGRFRMAMRDTRIAVSGSRFGITPAKLGIAFPQEDIHRLVGLVGRGHAARLLFSAATIGASEAMRIGLVDELVETGLEAAAADMAKAILANSADSISVLKRGVLLAVQGVAADRDQEAAFDDLTGSDEFARRLSDLRPGR